MPIFTLKDVTFKGIIAYPYIEIKRDKATFICGKSGCGKSTMLRLLNGVLTADSGSVRYNDKDISGYDTIKLRQEVLLCGQSVYLASATIRDNFAEFYTYRDLPTLSDSMMTEFLRLCAADFSLDTDCTTMSGGERQRVYTAICLSFLPRVLLLDEPTSALDDLTAATFFESITKFCHKEGITLIVVSHNKPLATQYANEIIDMECS